MIPFSLRFAAEAVGGTFYGPEALLGETVTGVTIDSRTAGPGILYVPVIGLVHDGHRFIDGAMKNGALCTFSDRTLDGTVPYILVKDTTAALQALSEKYLEVNRVPVVGVTGSAGKTSTKEMLDAVLSRRFFTYKTPGNLNNQTGVPQAVFQIEKDCQIAILEMGTNHPGEIRALAKITKPDIAVITNIGTAHIEFFGDREGIFKGKTEMLAYLQPDGKVVVNGDDDYLCRLSGAVLCGLGENCACRAVNIREEGLAGTSFTLCWEGTETEMFVPSPGIHMVYNALTAAAVGFLNGMTAEEIKAGVASYEPTAGRMHIVKAGTLTVLDDAYNANPASVKASVEVLKNAEGARKVCILGDMLELGEKTEEYHRECGVFAAENGIDAVIAVGPLSEQIYLGAEETVPGCAVHFPSREALLEKISGLIRPGDVVLVKASHGMHLELAVEAILNAEAAKQ